MSHWFSGWRLQPDASPGPLDAAFSQRALIRPYRPGPLRHLASAVGVIVVLIPMYSAIIVLFNPENQLFIRLITALSLGLIACGLGTLVGRLFATGVYVNDSGLRVVTMRRMVSVPWSRVVDVSTTAARLPLLGFPAVRSVGNAVFVTTRDGGPIRTPVTSRSMDFLGRSEAFDAAALAVERWWRDAGADARSNHQ
ncbi:MAG: PH domain-containing protein [Candidatus Nanopelagicales bacterium]